MIKKIFLASMLGLACMAATLLSGCGGGGGDNGLCQIIGPPNAPFIAHYPDGSSTRLVYGPTGSGIYSRISPFGHTYTCGEVEIIPGLVSGFSLTASPSTANLNALPPSITISGQAMDGTYGMPLVEYFDGSGYLVGSAVATAVAGDGTWLTTATPDLSWVYSGTYQVRVTNIRSDGWYLNIVGTATLSCYGRDRADSDYDGFYDDEDCYPYDPSRWSCGDPGGGCNEYPNLPAMECGPVY